MNDVLTNDKWKRRGISVLWCGKTLAELNAASQVIHRLLRSGLAGRYASAE